VKVVSTESSQVLAARIAEGLDVPLLGTEFSTFPDSELYLKTGELDGETIIVGSVVDSDAFIQLLLLIDACDSSENTLVLPYVGYSRQDRRFKSGEPVSARAVARALGRGVKKVITVNIHKEATLQHFQVPAVSITLASAIGRHIIERDLRDPLILAPDKGAGAFAADVAAVGSWDCDCLEKVRLSGREVRMEPKQIDASGRAVVMVDDIISTGGTIAMAAGMLYEQGAREISAACVHGVLSSGAYARLIAAGVTDIVSSDTYESACSRITAADAIADAVRKC